MSTGRIFAAAILVAVLACASSSGSSTDQSTGSTASRTAARAADVITTAELADPSVNSGDALAAVRRLRPQFLMSRGSGSVKSTTAGSTHVSIDGGPLLTLDALGRMRANDVAEIRYLNASAAAQRYGTIAGTGGVILVKSK